MVLNQLVGAREGSPLVVGIGNGERAGENFLASDAMALAGVTDQIVYLDEGDVVDLQLGKHWISARQADGTYRPVRREVRTVQAHTGAAELGPCRHYMHKEIFEQPRAIADTLAALHGMQCVDLRERRSTRVILRVLRPHWSRHVDPPSCRGASGRQTSLPARQLS